MSTIFQASSKAADAPNIEGGVYDAKFAEVAVKFITGGQFGDGDRFEWSFDLLDDDGNPLYDGGEPVSVEGLTSMSTNVASKTTPKAVRYLKALMTAGEFAQFETGEGFDAASLIGRKCQVEVYVKDSGWPGIANVLPARKPRRSAATTADAE